jgi:hypothetical protein
VIKSIFTAFLIENNQIGGKDGLGSEHGENI